jgi:hypothetical protein
LTMIRPLCLIPAIQSGPWSLPDWEEVAELWCRKLDHAGMDKM